VANKGDGTISGYTINATTGALSTVAGSPFAAGSAPNSLVVDNLGKFLYVANGGSNTVSIYAIDAMSGALTPSSGSPFTAAVGPDSIALSNHWLDNPFSSGNLWTASAESDDRYTQTSEGAMGREGKKRGWFRGTPALIRNPALCGRSGLRVQQAAMVSYFHSAVLGGLAGRLSFAAVVMIV